QSRLDEAELAAAIVTLAGKGYRVERLLPDHPRHRVGQLDLAARTLFLVLERAHHFGLQDVAPGDDLVRRRAIARRLFDEAAHFGERAMAFAGIDHAIARDILFRHFEHRDQIAA